MAELLRGLRRVPSRVLHPLRRQRALRALRGRRRPASVLVICHGNVCRSPFAAALLRPVFARYAALRMHGLVLFVAMLGGIVLFGGWGLLLGPLFVRLASEGLTILREERDISPS